MPTRPAGLRGSPLQDPAALRKRSGAALALVLTVGLAAAVYAQISVSGNIGSDQIEIDGPAGAALGQSANLYRTGFVNYLGQTFVNGPVQNTGAAADWVADDAVNTDPASITDSIATGIIPGVSGALSADGKKRGHWKGVRIVDGIAGNEQDIFLQGGKEDDTTTWNIGPGTVGSSKYDITQAYLASNQPGATGPNAPGHLYFGMERRGNNGTTAFDFEFNANAPNPATPLIPTRTKGDILFTFEMQGSGGSGSAVPHIFRWTGSPADPGDTPNVYKELTAAQIPPGVFTSINNAPTPAAPWGRVNARGTWDRSNLENFELGEAVVPFGPGGISLPGVNGCGGAAYVQVRTRSSSSATSDLKDTTKIFRFLFAGPSARQALTTNCLGQFTYDGTGSKDSIGGTNLSYQWTFTVDPTKAVLNLPGDAGTGHYSITQATAGPFTVDVVFLNGAGFADVTAQLTVDGGGCFDTAAAQTVRVYRPLSVIASLTGNCSNTLSFNATPSGGNPPYTYAWSIQRFDGTNWVQVGTSTAKSGTFTATSNGDYRAVVTVTDTAGTSGSAVTGKGVCQAAGTSPTVPARLPINPTIVKTNATADGTGVIMTATFQNPPDSIKWQVQGASTGTPSVFKDIAGSANVNPLTYSGFKADDTTPSSISFTLNGVLYRGLKYEVNIRLVATRTLNGQTCSENSNVLKVSYIEAADPTRRRNVRQIK